MMMTILVCLTHSKYIPAPVTSTPLFSGKIKKTTVGLTVSGNNDECECPAMSLVIDPRYHKLADTSGNTSGINRRK